MNSPVCEQLNLLLRQASYAPQGLRLAQLDGCEKIIKIIQPGSEYSFEFVRYQLTGYRPSKPDTDDQNIIGYDELITQINEYSYQLSGTMQIQLNSLERKFLTGPALAKKFHVSEKTISRWRSKGLVGRFLTFPDGKRRFAFSENIVDHFVEINRKKVNHASGFTKINLVTREAIITRLQQLAKEDPSSRWQSIKLVASEFNRSIESIRSILEAAIRKKLLTVDFETRAAKMPAELKREIYNSYEKGIAVADLCRKFDRSRSNIYHAIRLSQTEDLLAIDLRYIEAPEFADDKETEKLLNPEPALLTRHPKKAESPSKDAMGLDNKILEPDEEYFLFARYNYLKFLADQVRKTISLNNPSASDIAKARNYINQARKTREKIVETNLRLVMSVVRKHSHNNYELQEYISEGNMVLLNSVERFDFSKGNKFSTYATWALVKRFATLKAKLSRNYIPAGEEIGDVALNHRIATSQINAREAARKSLQKAMAQNLQQREQIIVQEHFGLIESSDSIHKPRSLAQIAEIVGLSKERVRQIEIFALKKLREVLTPEQFELLSGK
ncbi:MAG: sigma-70 family RNA polymerase sigma factor [Phycisphaerae bacterium]|nr:sigma-70 family RNA polymerase sigma factor [Phycisphaerae bacterium]